MEKLTRDTLKSYRNLMKKELEQNKEQTTVYVHMGTCGIASGAKEVLDALNKTLIEENLSDVRVICTGCAGMCSNEPMLTVALKNQLPVKYQRLNSQKVAEVVRKHVKSGIIVSDYVLAQGCEKMS